MADDRLELIASVKNLTSGPLKDIQRSMRALAADTTASHKLGVQWSKSHSLALNDLRKSVTDVGDRVRGVFTPALMGLGVGALSAAGGIAALKKAIGDFSETAHGLSLMTRATKMSAEQIKTWEELAGRVGSTAQAMDQGLKSFNEHMERLARHPRLEIMESFKES
jgi:hypothetical protein